MSRGQADGVNAPLGAAGGSVCLEGGPGAEAGRVLEASACYQGLSPLGHEEPEGVGLGCSMVIILPFGKIPPSGVGQPSR